MVYVKIELWPRGSQKDAKVLAEMNISNIGGTAEVGIYDVVISKMGGMARGVWRRGRVEGHKRKTHGGADLLFRALAQLLGQRNRDVQVPSEFERDCM